jgi:hypothetical protein
MGTVTIDPTSRNWAVLEAGKYGPGCEINAEVEITEFECPAEQGPAFDPDCEKGTYAFFKIQVRPQDNDVPINTIFHHEDISPNSGSRALGWLENIGVLVGDDGSFDPDLVAGTKCGVEMAEPRVNPKDPNKRYNKLKDVFGV